jgi:SpoVK/Ycf46/Vps4 family AAA+-type ATPase
LNTASIYSKYFGMAEESIRNIFSTARVENPSIIFFDEIDGLIGKREFNQNNNDVDKRVLSTLLNEMDGIEETKNILVIVNFKINLRLQQTGLI